MKQGDPITTMVGRLIKEWDPLGLLGSGAPEDEYDDVIQRIAAGLRACNSASNVQDLMFGVFLESYGEYSAGDRSVYLTVGAEIFRQLSLLRMSEKS